MSTYLILQKYLIHVHLPKYSHTFYWPPIAQIITRKVYYLIRQWLNENYLSISTLFASDNNQQVIPIHLASVVQRLDNAIHRINAIQRISVDKTNHAIHWIVI